MNDLFETKNIEKQIDRGLNPVGTIISFLGVKEPDGYLFCDGSEHEISDFPEFVDYLNEQFGSPYFFGGGGDHCAVPALRE